MRRWQGKAAVSGLPQFRALAGLHVLVSLRDGHERRAGDGRPADAGEACGQQVDGIGGCIIQPAGNEGRHDGGEGAARCGEALGETHLVLGRVEADEVRDAGVGERGPQAEEDLDGDVRYHLPSVQGDPWQQQKVHRKQDAARDENAMLAQPGARRRVDDGLRECRGNSACGQKHAKLLVAPMEGVPDQEGVGGEEAGKGESGAKAPHPNARHWEVSDRSKFLQHGRAVNRVPLVLRNLRQRPPLGLGQGLLQHASAHDAADQGECGRGEEDPPPGVFHQHQREHCGGRSECKGHAEEAPEGAEHSRALA
mmetsp:Transcript_6982/g.19774  ORF Transcript_6982/g.19774 Transcript_6982/m.19774 type:complete len:310 (-) Transcript_6982:657-1586(-)